MARRPNVLRATKSSSDVAARSSCVHIADTMPDDHDDLRRSLYELVFEHSLDATVVFDAQGRVLLLNRAARELPDEWVDRLFAGHPSHPTELTFFRDQLETRGKAHAEVRVGSRSIAIEGCRHGAQYVVVVRDESRLRRLEHELRSLQRLDSLGHFTASLVHDFNNLLTPIACLSGCLESELAHDEEAGAMARDIRDAADRAARLAREMMKLVRREPPRVEAVNVAAAVSDLRSLVERMVGSDVKVEVTVSPDTGATVIDRERLEHAILNLAANARDAMPEGGTLTVSTSRVAFDEDQAETVEGARAGAYIAIRVRDTGVGMSREVREHVFERFFTTKEPGHGTGLGLASVRRFVAESGGCVTVHSREGRGTVVSLYLPAYRSTATAVPSPSPAFTPAPASLPTPAPPQTDGYEPTPTPPGSGD
jgi:two-component system, cell cycle sensor histidine kinase and response regulator CckA